MEHYYGEEFTNKDNYKEYAEWANDNHGVIDFIKQEDGIYYYRICEVVVSEEEKISFEIQKLENWFNNYFDKQLTQSSWQKDYVPSYDEIFGLYYLDIEEVKAKAEEVRNRIKTLKMQLPL